MKSFVTFISGSRLRTDILKNRMSWIGLYEITILAILFYILSETIFFASKPSFMNFMNPFSVISLTFLITLVCFILVLPFLAVVGLGLLLKLTPSIKLLFLQIGLLLPSFIFATLFLLLIDNFTYTVFGFGIVKAYGVVRGVYAVIYLVILVFTYRALASILRIVVLRMTNTRTFWLINVFILLPLTILVFRTDWGKVFQAGQPVAQCQNKPNIILLGSDGLSAKYMSAYGYSKPTTPFLETFLSSSLVAENAFTNVAHSTGSIVAMLNSKSPLETKLMFPLVILHGVEKYEHLPGILKQQGYLTVQMGTPFYIDADAANLRDAFDVVNGNRSQKGSISRFIAKFDIDNLPYYWDELIDRASDRLLHILFIANMPDLYKQVTEETLIEQDQEKIDEIIRLLESSEQPVFVQAHLMGTHSPYAPAARVFSAEIDDSESDRDEFYEDTLLSYDNLVEELVNYLEDSRKISNTILVLYSDHAKDWTDIEKIPLIVHFPKDDYKGKITADVQNIDIAPTLLDYMGLPIPNWMQGESLLENQFSPMRAIFSTDNIGIITEEDPRFSSSKSSVLDLNGFRYVDVFVCQSLTRLDLLDRVWYQTEIKAYTSPCDASSLPSLADRQKMILNRLKQSGFDISSIEGNLPVKILER